MTNYNVQVILNQYTNKEQETLKYYMNIMAFIGAGNAPETKEEFIEWCEMTLKNKKEKEKKEQEIKTAKINKEITKAKEMGLTLEEYKEYKATKANRTRNLHQIEELEKELAKARARLAFYERKLEKYNK